MWYTGYRFKGFIFGFIAKSSDLVLYMVYSLRVSYIFVDENFASSVFVQVGGGTYFIFALNQSVTLLSTNWCRFIN